MTQVPKHTLAARRIFQQMLKQAGFRLNRRLWPQAIQFVPEAKTMVETTFMFSDLYICLRIPPRRLGSVLYRFGLVRRAPEAERGYDAIRQWSDCVDAIRRAAACPAAGSSQCSCGGTCAGDLNPAACCHG